MNRRSFLSLLAPAGAALLAPDLLLPARSIFLPPAGGWPADIYGYHAAFRPAICEGVPQSAAQALTLVVIEHGRTIPLLDVDPLADVRMAFDGKYVAYVVNGLIARHSLYSEGMDPMFYLAAKTRMPDSPLVERTGRDFTVIAAGPK
jgi:hypothetical protein